MDEHRKSKDAGKLNYYTSEGADSDHFNSFTPVKKVLKREPPSEKAEHSDWMPKQLESSFDSEHFQKKLAK